MGSIATDLALVAALLTAFSAAVGAISGQHRTVALQIARVTMVASTALVGLAVAGLGRALWVVDPALIYVGRHSSTQTPLAYRLAGIWGGMEGSLLFWAFIVACTFAAAVIAGRSWRPGELLAVTAVGGVTVATFLFVGRAWASPFERLTVPSGSGDGLLAVLQHPAMIYHPPILYLGLALTGVPFALTLLALAQHRLDDRWRAQVTPWIRAGWLVLGVGIVTGSQWAYAELGWGGFWAWDPVENSSLLPWLAATVALHLLANTGTQLQLGAAAAVVSSFCLMVCGVYITRSGNTGSIHAFSESPEIARPLLIFAGVTAGVGLAAIGRHGFAAPDDRLSLRSRVLQLHAVLGAIAVLAIAFGTFWPVLDGLVFSDVGTRALVQPQYYHRALAPVVALALAAMAVGPLVGIRTAGDPRQRLSRLAAILLAGAVAAIVIAALAAGSTEWFAASKLIVTATAGAAVAGAIVYGARVAKYGRRSIGVAVAHCGFAIVLLGAVASSGGSDDTVRIEVGDTIELESPGDAGVHQVTLVELTTGTEGRFEFVRGVLEVQEGDRRQRYYPELRAYEQQRIPTAEAVIDGSLRGDTIVVLEAIGEDLRSATLTVRTRPLLPWVWFGAVLVVAGGLATLAGPKPRSPSAPDAETDRAATAAQQ